MNISPSLRQYSDSMGALLLNWREVVNQVALLFTQARSAEQRVALLQVFDAIMDLVEPSIVTEDLDRFRKLRVAQYQAFIAEEALVGEHVCAETLNAITEREIAAGRMAENDPLRDVALRSMAAPHLTRAQLVQLEATRRANGNARVSTARGPWARR